MKRELKSGPLISLAAVVAIIWSLFYHHTRKAAAGRDQSVEVAEATPEAGMKGLEPQQAELKVAQVRKFLEQMDAYETQLQYDPLASSTTIAGATDTSAIREIYDSIPADDPLMRSQLRIASLEAQNAAITKHLALMEREEETEALRLKDLAVSRKRVLLEYTAAVKKEAARNDGLRIAKDLASGWEKNFIGKPLPPVINQAGVKIYGLFPYAGPVRVRISNLGTTDPCVAPSLSGATNSTLVEFEVTSECDYFIASLIENAQFLDSLGKVIGEGYFVVRRIKPRNRATGCATVFNLAREKLLTWRLEPGAVRPTVHIQPIEGSNVLAQVTVETW